MVQETGTCIDVKRMLRGKGTGCIEHMRYERSTANVQEQLCVVFHCRVRPVRYNRNKRVPLSLSTPRAVFPLPQTQ